MKRVTTTEKACGANGPKSRAAGTEKRNGKLAVYFARNRAAIASALIGAGCSYEAYVRVD